MKPFSVVIPVFNEEEILVQNVETLTDHLLLLNTPFEIIIINNGSTDRTESLGRELERKYEFIRFISLHRRGVGFAFKTGVLAAKYEHIISLDIDLSIELNFIEKANRLLENYDIVIGAKILGKQRRSFVRRIGSYTYIYIARWLLGLSFHDYSIGAKAYRRDFVLRHIERIDPYTHYVLNLTVAAKGESAKIVEIPIVCVDFRKSRFNLLKEGFYRFYMLFKTYFRERGVDNKNQRKERQ